MENTLQLRTPKLTFTDIGKYVLMSVVFILSISISYSQNENSNVDGGTISTTDDTTQCLNYAPNIVDVTLTGDSGMHSQWIITDIDNTILSLPDSPPFDFSNAGPGVCRIWHLSYNGIPPFRHIPNLDDLRGRYDLSNYIEITRTEAEGGVLVGGPFEFLVGDGIPDMIPEGSISLSGEAGDNSQWVVTDTDGNILGLPSSPYVVNFDGAGSGTCLIWNLSFANGLEGAVVGNNVSDLSGCFDLSNPVEVIRTELLEGGELTGGPFEFCVGDGEPDMIPEGSIELTGNFGDNSQWVVTDTDGTILGLPPTPYVVNFDAAGGGICLVWNLTYEDGLEGLSEGSSVFDLMGNYDFSNSILVIRNQPEGGTLTGGPFEFTVGDGVADMIPEGSISLTGEIGDNSQWVVTDTDGNILGLPPTPYAVDFDDAGEGTCLIWHLSYFNGLEGAEVGNNTADLMGCFDLSNSVEVIRNEVGGRLFMYPNPASNTVYLDMTSLNYNTVSVRIFNMQNVEVFNNTYTNQVSDRGSAIIDVSDYQGGIYLVNATSQNGQSIVGKLVIR